MDGKGSKLLTAGESELPEHLRQMVIHCTDGYAQTVGDLLACQTPRRKDCHLPLPPGQGIRFLSGQQGECRR